MAESKAFESDTAGEKTDAHANMSIGAEIAKVLTRVSTNEDDPEFLPALLKMGNILWKAKTAKGADTLWGFVENGGFRAAFDICGSKTMLSRKNADVISCLIKILVECNQYGKKLSKIALETMQRPMLPVITRMYQHICESHDKKTEFWLIVLFTQLLRTRGNRKRMREELFADAKIMDSETLICSPENDWMPLLQKIFGGKFSKTGSIEVHIGHSFAITSATAIQIGHCISIASAIEIVLTRIPEIETKAKKSDDAYLAAFANNKWHTKKQLALVGTLVTSGWFDRDLPKFITWFNSLTTIQKNYRRHMMVTLGDLLRLFIICLFAIRINGWNMPDRSIWKKIWVPLLTMELEVIKRYAEIIKETFSSNDAEFHKLIAVTKFPLHRSSSIWDNFKSAADARVCHNVNCENKEDNDKIKFKNCSRCKIVCYCSVECQKAHWKEHKALCKPAESLDGDKKVDT